MPFSRLLTLTAIVGVSIFPSLSAAQDGNKSIQGEWTTDCLPIGKNGRHGYVTRITITDNEIKATSQIYAKRQCQTPTVQVNFAGSLIHDQDEGGQVHIEHVVGTLTTTPNIKDVVDHYNKETSDSAGCGLTGWQENVPVSVAGKTCGPFTFAAEGTHLYDSLWVAGNQLRFGAFPVAWTNTSAGKTPSKPLDTIYYRTGR